MKSGARPSLFRCGRLLNRRSFAEHAANSPERRGAAYPYRQKRPSFVSQEHLPSHDAEKDPNAWVSVLDSVIPTALRASVPESQKSTDEGQKLSPQDVAHIIALARRTQNIDILAYLGELGQWRTAVWLVNYLVDNLWKSNPNDKPISLPGPWNSLGALDKITNKHVRLPEIAPQPRAAGTSSASFEAAELAHPLDGNDGKKAGHAALGQIWQSLGNMILRDAERDGPITSEILEIIAKLHHHGIMPESIYTYAPLEDKTALRQPPTLHLLSSHILTSLSDAAWRAHQAMVIEQTRATGGVYLPLRPEIPGSMYRVRVGGLGHEVWLELVLWSCLSGGWTSYGAAILEAMTQKATPHAWAALSWRETVSPMVKAGQERRIDWDEVRYMYSTAPSSEDPTAIAEQRKKVKNTISSEVITAYVDALVNIVRVGVGDRGIAFGDVLRYIQTLKSFLENGKNNLGLESNSWDAVVLRVCESQGIDVGNEPALAEQILDLSSPYGKELSFRNAPTRDEQWQPLSPYLLDGTASTLGLAHRVLHAHVAAGNLAGAIRTFQKLQLRTDTNKKRSIEEFFRTVKERKDIDDQSTVNFESRYANLEYPAYYPQIPVTVLAPFLDLVTDAKALDFGNWLITSEDVDGAIITPSMYNDPVMLPSLVRFTSATQDKNLVGKMLKAFKSSPEMEAGRTSSTLLIAVLEHQIEMKDWQSARKTLASLVYHSIGVPKDLARALAVVARSLLISRKSVEPTNNSFEQALDLFNFVFGRSLRRSKAQRAAVDNILVLLACVGPEWANLCLRLRPPSGSFSLEIHQQNFNVILQGILEAYGSDAGIKFLGTFWAPAREAQKTDLNVAFENIEDGSEGVPRMPAERPSPFARHPSTRFRLTVSSQESAEGAIEPHSLRVFGNFRPNNATIRHILRQSIAEMDGLQDGVRHVDAAISAHQDGGPKVHVQHPKVQWAIHMFRELGMRGKDIRQEVEGKVSKR